VKYKIEMMRRNRLSRNKAGDLLVTGFPNSWTIMHHEGERTTKAERSTVRPGDRSRDSRQGTRE